MRGFCYTGKFKCLPERAKEILEKKDQKKVYVPLKKNPNFVHGMRKKKLERLRMEKEEREKAEAELAK